MLPVVHVDPQPKPTLKPSLVQNSNGGGYSGGETVVTTAVSGYNVPVRQWFLIKNYELFIGSEYSPFYGMYCVRVSYPTVLALNSIPWFALRSNTLSELRPLIVLL